MAYTIRGTALEDGTVAYSGDNYSESDAKKYAKYASKVLRGTRVDVVTAEERDKYIETERAAKREPRIFYPHQGR